MDPEPQLQKPITSKQQASRKMDFGDQQKQRQIKGGNASNQLNTHSGQNISQRKCTQKQITFLFNQLGVDRIKGANILKKMELKDAVKYLINQ